MGLKINSSLNATHTQSRVNQHSKNIAESIRRISSGLRINSSSDDAAGLGITVRLQSQITSIKAAMKNTQEGINFAQTADGTLNEVEQILQSIRQLVVLGLNETNNSSDRGSIQEEIDALKGAVGANLESSQFNGIGIFNGDFYDKGFQIGKDVTSGLRISVNKISTQSLGQRLSLVSSSGVDTSTRLLSTNSGPADTFTLGGAQVRESNAADDTVSVVSHDRSAIAKAAAINASIEDTGVRATALATRTDRQVTLDAELGGGVFGSSGAVQEVTLTASTYLKINHVEITGFTVRAGDADGSLVSAINDRFEDTGVLAELDASGQLVLVAPDGRNLLVEYEGDNSGDDLESLIGLRDGGGVAYGGQLMLESDESIDIDFGANTNTAVGDLVGDYSHANLAVFGLNRDSALSALEVTSSSGRRDALNIIDQALSQISDERTFFGALQNRFAQTTLSLENEMINLESAKSNIESADFSYESARLSLSQIQLNASVSVLAQANIDPILAFALVQ